MKKTYFFTALTLIFTLISSVTLEVAAQTSSQLLGVESWKPPANFVDPVTLKIREFKAQGLADNKITEKLAELGMGWYPETGATWIGRPLTAEELAIMPPRVSVNSAQDNIDADVTSGRSSYMRTFSASWTGIGIEVVSGPMNVAAGGTTLHYLCVQLGDLDGSSNWAETVLTHNLNQNFRWNTFDNDEGDWQYYKDKNTPTTSADTYVMMLDGTKDSNGWKYDIWINYQWVRSAHLTNLFVQGGMQKEVYSETGAFTNDGFHSYFARNWLHNADGWSCWTNSITTKWDSQYPLHESHYMGPTTYVWETWVQN